LFRSDLAVEYLALLVLWPFPKHSRRPANGAALGAGTKVAGLGYRSRVWPNSPLPPPPDSSVLKKPRTPWGFFYFHDRKFIFEGLCRGIAVLREIK
jgi:hypothetical protein